MPVADRAVEVLVRTGATLPAIPSLLSDYAQL
jgi:hypothetical protein